MTPTFLHLEQTAVDEKRCECQHTHMSLQITTATCFLVKPEKRDNAFLVADITHQSYFRPCSKGKKNVYKSRLAARQATAQFPPGETQVPIFMEISV